ncbi:MAG: ABC transporter substrate-binding protein [Streptomyces sp.]|nr:ABC transporter substrate-binding protein [Streptomyces sp.]NUR42459.1 ABC transporter substrate-binding protein [Streptomyces sp.]NUS14070.1 ABC transporter substrate-binding protein [Streptomyces sp.]NUS23820.1 ABC transporter substrate-binding protein [Streptomyces sp.]NUS79651.1 ABC transporter substrate-binding protein [Streptomyces sp.]
MPINRPVAAGLAVALCLLATACGGSSEQGDGSDGQDREAAASKAGYPVTLDNCGREETFEKAPSRVVVMNGASVAEVSTLLALGLEDRIIANQQGYGMSEVPGRAAAVKALPTGDVALNDAYDIPREAMFGLRPDLVLSLTSYGFDEKNGFATRGQLREIGANSYVSPQGCDDEPSRMTLADSYRLLRDMGRIFDVGDRAEKLIAASEKSIATVAEKVEGEQRPKVMVLFSHMTMGANEFSSVVSNGIVNDILAKAGAVNAFADASRTTFADLSKEKVAATDVDAVVVIAYNDPNPAAYAEKLLKEFPQWPAARNHTYVTLSDSMYLGPSNDLAVRKIARTLHPDVF